ncbi:MAG: methylenetetrahydrofolate--tRNA-(uracil(54)-C(5))-methyltransferase (FADH(2)-oxidizing) TrmFO [Candidatus Caenarcaniphilales bacterium]|nr:methylenetetrahydrofolate--tRNA-(uracil(54)-C(5))-methyltransferase (FADH(2)-oxidizing) TrmFO [Candidatus Caenarcaniphilales bacterium]
MPKITIIGAGLAGTETASQLAKYAKKYQLDLEILLYEMRPKVKTPAHHTDNFAELVCSNSLGSEFLSTARGLLIREMQHFDSLIINSALASKVPAGQALAVDRDKFAEIITDAICKENNIQVIREEFETISEEILAANSENYLVIASGPLTSPSLASEIQKLAQNQGFLKFFDAASPILSADSVNMDIAFKASRYGKGETDDYINCPFYDKDEYYRFWQALLDADKAPLKDFEKENIKYFEGCMPVEAIAARGKDTLRFGPLKPVGLTDPRCPDKKAFAVVQLRQDNVVGSLYNIVGFQTNLKWGEQKRVFSMIPGLENLDIVRYGVMHQNIYLNSPLYLNPDLALKNHPNIFFAGQITGVEGYTESAATGLLVARNIISKIQQQEFKALPQETMLGALAHYISHADPKNFQPMNSNWGIINTNPDDMEKKIRKNKKMKNEFLANRALSLISSTETAPMVLS